MHWTPALKEAATAPARQKLAPWPACVRVTSCRRRGSLWGEYPQIGKNYIAPQKFCFQFFIPAAALQSLFAGRLLVHYRRLKSGIDSSHPVGGTLHISESVFQRRICPLELILGSWHILCYEKDTRRDRTQKKNGTNYVLQAQCRRLAERLGR